MTDNIHSQVSYPFEGLPERPSQATQRLSDSFRSTLAIDTDQMQMNREVHEIYAPYVGPITKLASAMNPGARLAERTYAVIEQTTEHKRDRHSTAKRLLIGAGAVTAVATLGVISAAINEGEEVPDVRSEMIVDGQDMLQNDKSDARGSNVTTANNQIT